MEQANRLQVCTGYHLKLKALCIGLSRYSCHAHLRKTPAINLFSSGQPKQQLIHVARSRRRLTFLVTSSVVLHASGEYWL